MSTRDPESWMDTAVVDTDRQTLTCTRCHQPIVRLALGYTIAYLLGRIAEHHRLDHPTTEETPKP